MSEQEKLLATERNLAQMREDCMATLTHDLKTPMLGEKKTLKHLLEGTLGEINFQVIRRICGGSTLWIRFTPLGLYARIDKVFQLSCIVLAD